MASWEVFLKSRASGTFEVPFLKYQSSSKCGKTDNLSSFTPTDMGFVSFMGCDLCHTYEGVQSIRTIEHPPNAFIEIDGTESEKIHILQGVYLKNGSMPSAFDAYEVRVSKDTPEGLVLISLRKGEIVARPHLNDIALVRGLTNFESSSRPELAQLWLDYLSKKNREIQPTLEEPSEENAILRVQYQKIGDEERVLAIKGVLNI